MPLLESVVAGLIRAAGEYVARRRAAASSDAQIEDPEDPATWIGLDYVHDQVRAQMVRQQRLWEEADGRLRLILGVIGIVFAVTLGLIPRSTITVATANGATSTAPLLLPFLVGVTAIAGLILFAAAGLVAVIAYWPRDFSWPPAPDSLRKYITSNEREIKLTVVDEMLDAYELNDVWIGRKVLAFRWALIITGIATAALGTSVIIELAQLTRAWS